MNEKEKEKERTERTEEPQLPFWLNWEVYRPSVLFFMDVMIFSTLLLVLGRVMDTIEITRTKLLRNSKKIDSIMQHILDKYNADRVVICEYRVPFRVNLKSDVYRIVPTYEVTRSGVTSVSNRFNRATCGTAILESFANNSFVVRHIQEIENSLYRSFLRSFDVQTAVYCAIHNSRPIGFVALHYCFSEIPKNWDGLLEDVNEITYLSL